MGFETISQEGWEDYEVWTCDKCGYSVCLNGTGGDIAECPRCISREYEEDARQEEQAKLSNKKPNTSKIMPKPKQCQYCDQFTNDLKISKLKHSDPDCIGYFWLCEDCREDNKEPDYELQEARHNEEAETSKQEYMEHWGENQNENPA